MKLCCKSKYIFYNMESQGFYSKSFEEKMLWYSETSLKFQESVLKSLLKIETKLKNPGYNLEITEHLGDLARIITSRIDEQSEYLQLMQRRSADSKGGKRKFTKKYR